MTHQPTERELGIIAEEAELPHGISVNVIGLTVVCESEPGDRLPSGDFAGTGGSRRWGVAWFNGLTPVTPFIHLFPEGVKATACTRLISIIRELTVAPVKERHDRLVREAQERRDAAEAEAAAAAKASAKTLKRAGLRTAD